MKRVYAPHLKEKRKEKQSSIPLEIGYDPVEGVPILEILNRDELSPFFLLRDPKFGPYRINITSNGIHMTK